jgi:hypothetical protein
LLVSGLFVVIVGVFALKAINADSSDAVIAAFVAACWAFDQVVSFSVALVTRHSLLHYVRKFKRCWSACQTKNDKEEQNTCLLRFVVLKRLSMKTKEASDYNGKLEHHVGAFVEKPLYDRVQAAAKAARRPVSQWLRLLLEQATTGYAKAGRK